MTKAFIRKIDTLCARIETAQWEAKAKGASREVLDHLADSKNAMLSALRALEYER